ncbi:hypothetical protein [Devosia sp.]|uniref:hypothetical protein n=1 Tax=Devosia sp. TaxID=1871048 RepID=UPI002EFEB7BE
MNEPSALRLNLLRAGYALIVVGQGIRLAPQLLDPSYGWELQRSVVVSMLTAMVLLSALGLRYPLKMLPVLFFESRGRPSGCCGSLCQPLLRGQRTSRCSRWS